ncbi:hypothetical protein A0257_12400 [Hymenobacter psoromatis]|nr:hypothetical protein A0257_12400 [Hymenobacter psoromatis]
MDINKRFDQLESLLVDLARKQDQQAEQIARIIQILNGHGEAINSLGELLNSHTELLNSHTELLNSHTEVLNSHTGILQRQEVRLDNISDQIGDIITILKISEARHTETEQRQDAMMAEIQQQGKRQDVAVDALKVLFKRQQTTDTRLDELVQTELQMLQLMRRDAEKLEDHEPRLKRLEDEFLRPAG